jgi:zinc transport system permease protein
MFYHHLEQAILWFSSLWPEDSIPSYPFYVRTVLAIVLACLVCGAAGSLVVGNRMSFFSDALAHCAFAGVALGFLLALFAGMSWAAIREDRLFLTSVMVGFGILIGILIAFVREKTSLSNDTVIGVFFAGAIGLGAMLLKAVSARGFINLEALLFGDPTLATELDLELLTWLLLLTGTFLWLGYNDMVFASFSTSLARSRGISTRLWDYGFIVLLGVIVNLCIQVVGVLLINAMLIVPAATAANWSRNMRQFFRNSVLLALLVGVLGFGISLFLQIPDPPREALRFGISGTIVVTSVLFFTLSMLTSPLSRLLRRAPAAPQPLQYSADGPRMVASGEPHRPPPA